LNFLSYKSNFTALIFSLPESLPIFNHLFWQEPKSKRPISRNEGFIFFIGLNYFLVVFVDNFLTS